MKPAQEWIRAVVVFAILLNVSFFPFIWGDASLMSAARESPSTYPWGAARHPGIVSTTGKLRDAIAPATEMEPGFALEHHIVFDEHHLPIWNPWSGFGTPLAADMQSEPYFPLTALVLAHPTPKLHALWVVARLFVAAMLAFFYLRSFVSFWPAIGGGTLFLYTGYFLLFVNIGHLSVETLLPGVFLGHERLLRERSARNVVVLASITALVLLGGMPESALLALTFGVLYWTWRACTPPFERAWLLALRDMFVSSLCGCGLAAFLIVPFLEFVRFSLNQHANASNGIVFGTFAVPFDVHVLTYIVPLLFGPMGNTVAAGAPGWIGPDGFFGIAALFLGLVAVSAAIRDARDPISMPSNRIVWFFALLALFAFFKRFALPEVQWIGSLPLFRLVDFLKYDEPLLGFAMATLAAVGMDRIASSARRSSLLLPSIVATLLVLTAGYVATAWIVRDASPSISTYYDQAWYVALATYVAICSIALVWIRLRGAGPCLLVAVCFAECISNYLIPMYYRANEPARIAENPYLIPPYAEYLRNHLQGGERVIGLAGNLYPTWSAAYGLNDPENLNALYPARYLTFVRTFLSSTAPYDLVDRFTGTGESVSDTSLERRFLILGSIAYVVVTDPIDVKPESFDEVYDRDVRIYRVRGVLPRAAIFYQIVPAGAPDAALAELKRPSFDVRSSATVLTTGATESALSTLRQMPESGTTRATPASIVSSDSEETTIEAIARQPGLLVYNDTNFPGWKAFVDGKPAPIYDANYLFRGVLVPAGRHIVRFRYEPDSLREGFIVSVVSVLILAAFCSSVYPSSRGRS